MRETTHECGPHWRDAFEGGWTNCWLCIKPIYVEGPPGAICPVVSSQGRCDLPKGHVDMHETDGLAWTA